LVDVSVRGLGALIGVALIVAGMAFGTRTFQRDSA